MDFNFSILIEIDRPTVNGGITLPILRLSSITTAKRIRNDSFLKILLIKENRCAKDYQRSG